MNNIYRNIALIPARGGSKSIKDKNIKEIAGKPLIYWTLEAAIGATCLEKVFVSTDSEKIKNVVQALNSDKVEIVSRSLETATDFASTESVMLEFAQTREFENIMLIQATSPLLNSKQIDEAFSKYFNEGADSLISVVRQKRFLWEEIDNVFVKPINYDYYNRPRRQEFNGFLVENGAFYITSRERLLLKKCRISGNIVAFDMPEIAYYELDEPMDWMIIEKYLKFNKNKKISLKEKFQNIKLIATDVDGVLTDSGMYYSEKGDELKKFNTRDGKAFELFKKKQIKTAIITGESTEIVKKRSEKLQIDFLFQGVKNKLAILKDIAKKNNLNLNEIVYIGDDINDFEVMKNVGISFAPFDAVNEIKAIVDYVCETKGGAGCIREIYDIFQKIN